jgi:hypothetical protein
MKPTSSETGFASHSPNSRLSTSARPSRPALPLFSFLAFSFVLAFAAGCGSDGSSKPAILHPEDFLPPGTEAMQKDGSPRTATDTAGLQDIVNGGFEVYTNSGFREMVEQMYSGTVGGANATVRVWIFDQATSDNAVALHEEILQEGTWEQTDEIGDAQYRRTELFASIILFRRDQYSAQLEISANSQDAKDLLVLFATHVDQEMTKQ